MRRAVAALAVFAFSVAFVQSPWAHIHVHSYDPDHERQHIGLDALHGHGLHRPELNLQWRRPNADDDARSLGPVTAVRMTTVAPDFSVDRIEVVAAPPVIVVPWVVDLSPRAHGPPGFGFPVPRAPPA